MAQNLVRGWSDTILYTNDLGGHAAWSAGKMRPIQSAVGAATTVSEVCVLKSSCADLATVPAWVRGMFSYTAKAGAGEVWTVGVPLFYDTATDSLTQVSGVATCVFAGVAAEAKANATTTGTVILNWKVQGIAVPKGANPPIAADFALLIDSLVASGYLKFST